MNRFIGLDYQAINEKLDTIIESLENNRGISIADLNKIINMLLEEYFEAVGEYPKSYVLTRLSNIILGDDFRDKDRLKSKKKEYPVLSTTQIRFRDKHETPLPADKIEFFSLKYTHNMGSTHKTKTRQIDE
ncbi:MAG: hypothetical protein K0S71_297 [Clostridia bacterium]|jgi:hypothetical protein|nr:hypothetical protein [Clostridia bacterium]